MICFDFKGFYGVDSCCGLDLIQIEGFTLVVCTHLNENRGSSVTGFCDQLIKIIAEKFSLDLDRVIMMEMLPEDHRFPQNVWNLKTEENFCLVTFERKSDDPSALRNPFWTPISPEIAEKLILGDNPFGDNIADKKVIR